MPSLGADMDSGTLLEWLVHPGDQVHRGQPVAVVDTDKAAIEIESFHDGVMESVLVEPGRRVSVGTPLATIASGDGAAGPEPGPVSARVPAAGPAPPPAPEAPAGPAPAPAPAPEERLAPVRDLHARRRGTPPVRHHAAELGVDLDAVTGTGRRGAITRADVDRAARLGRTPPRAPAARTRPASPYARRLARELGIDLGRIAGTGVDGTVRAQDVLLAAGHPTPPEAGPPTVAGGPTHPERPRVPAPTGGPRATIAALMSRSKREVPHYYVATTVDMQPVVEWLRRGNRERAVADRVVPAAVLLKATALAARRFPELNGFWREDGFEPADDVHLGVAVSVRHGALVAPALHNTADLDVPTIMQRLRDLVTRARTGRLTRAELTDPTLTVTDLGDQGVEEVIGVIYPPQVSLLGVGRMVERPWAVGGLLGVRPVVRLTLSGDHRATDGYTGARFLATVEQLLQQPEDL